jgi:hypothetical protein
MTIDHDGRSLPRSSATSTGESALPPHDADANSVLLHDFLSTSLKSLSCTKESTLFEQHLAASISSAQPACAVSKYYIRHASILYEEDFATIE